MKDLCNMPEDMAFQILARLPPKSLFRFKCVRKSWHSMINNPLLVTMHLSNSTHNNLTTSTCLLIKRSVLNNTETDHKETLFTLLSFTYDNDIDGDDDEEHNNVQYVAEDIAGGQFFGFEDLEAARFYGHCDGIICLADTYRIVLWNPAIREFKSFFPEPYVNALGFGYDLKSGDYKVVNIEHPAQVQTFVNDEHVLFSPPIVKIYTLSSCSWRNINTDTLETETTVFCPVSFQMYYKGFCYWTGREQLKEFQSVYDQQEEDSIREWIISFDMSDEVFRTILYPDCICEESSTYWFDLSVIVWNESVALLARGYYDTDSSVDEFMALWVMDGFGGVKGYSWTKLFAFPVLEGVGTPLRSWNNDVILMVSKDGRIVLYNLDTEMPKYLPIRSMDSDSFEVVVCGSSIVPLARINS